MIHLLVVSTAKNTNRILGVLTKQHAEVVEIAMYLGRKEAHFHSSSISRMSHYSGQSGHLCARHDYGAAANTVFESVDYLYYRDLFVEHLMRGHHRYHHRAHRLNEPQEFYDYFHIVTDAIAREITARGVTHCLFFNIPHLGYDTAVYCVAKAMNIPIVIVTQSSLLADHYFSMADPKDFGCLPPQTEPAAPFPIVPEEKLDLHYMQGIKQQAEKHGNITAKALLQLIVFMFYKRRWRALNPFYWGKLISHMQRVYGHFPKWRDPFAGFFHEDSLAYFDHLAQFEHQTPDLSGDFVYFPLQLQPEMTTATLGGRFRDQAYALERLSELLPDHVRILVKENPKQGSYMRGPLFFHRLKRLPKVTLLPCWVDTYQLIKQCRFVATITGTAGFEALKFGKPTLVFGTPWYGDFPGVFRYGPDVRYQHIVEYQSDHQKLEQAMGRLMQRAHQGSVDRHYERRVKYADIAEHDAQIAANLVDLLHDHDKMTFPPSSS